jgi:sugar phosphate isomerase/epimerase
MTGETDTERNGWQRGLSTLGCLELSIDDLGRLARAHGVSGIELRTGLVPLPDADVVKTTLAAYHVEAFSIASSARLTDPESAEEQRRILRSDLALARDLGAGYVRVFPGGTSVETAASHLEDVADLLDADDSPIVALETHDHLPTGRAIAEVIATLDHPRLGAVWDVLHPWRHDEPIAASAEALLGLPGYVQVKDAVSLDDPTPCLLGAGAVPLHEFRTQLEAHAYAGWVSLEWERAWHPHVPPLDVALESARNW